MNIVEHILLPVANEADAFTTARQLEPYEPNRVSVLHVVEKGEGVPDKTPVAQSEELADKCFAAVQSVFPDANKHTAYARDIVTAIFEAAGETEASAIAYRSRGGGRIVHYLSGDLTFKLVTRSSIPVIALPSDRSSK